MTVWTRRANDCCGEIGSRRDQSNNAEPAIGSRRTKTGSQQSALSSRLKQRQHRGSCQLPASSQTNGKSESNTENAVGVNKLRSHCQNQVEAGNAHSQKIA